MRKGNGTQSAGAGTAAVIGELVPLAVASEMVKLEGLGYSSWAQMTYARLAGASETEREDLARDIKDEALLRARHVGEGLQSLFEALDLMKRFELHKKLGYPTMRKFMVQAVAPEVGLHRSTVSLMAGALEERELQEKEFGCSKAPWTINARLSAETKRQDQGKGLLAPEKYRELRERAARGELRKEELLAELQEVRRGPEGGSGVAPRKESPRCPGTTNETAAGAAGAAGDVGNGARCPGTTSEPAGDEFRGLDATVVDDAGVTLTGREILVRELERTTREAQAMERRLAALAGTSPADWDHVDGGELGAAITTMHALEERMVQCRKRLEAAQVYRQFGDAATITEDGGIVIDAVFEGSLESPFMDEDAEDMDQDLVSEQPR